MSVDGGLDYGLQRTKGSPYSPTGPSKRVGERDALQCGRVRTAAGKAYDVHGVQ
jgi:hypothetical protein